MGWTKLAAVDPHGGGCLNCPSPTKKASLDRPIAVGFGAAYVTRDGEEVYDGERDLHDGKEPRTIREVEEKAAADPDHDWQIVLHGPLHGETYQRHGEGEWVCVETNQGFA